MQTFALSKDDIDFFTEIFKELAEKNPSIADLAFVKSEETGEERLNYLLVRRLEERIAEQIEQNTRQVTEQVTRQITEAMGLSPEQVANGLNLPIEKVKELQNVN
ncbi:MAG: hypothetical protein FWG68_06365 [Defluviitaleaceae bacterium]|nr:hypothetical protein [Defluviitaleaceae bacterium]